MHSADGSALLAPFSNMNDDRTRRIVRTLSATVDTFSRVERMTCGLSTRIGEGVSRVKGASARNQSRSPAHPRRMRTTRQWAGRQAHVAHASPTSATRSSKPLHQPIGLPVEVQPGAWGRPPTCEKSTMVGTMNPEPVNRMSTSTRAEALLWAARASVDTPASRAVYWAVSRLDSTAVLSRHVWIKESVCVRGRGGRQDFLGLEWT